MLHTHLFTTTDYTDRKPTFYHQDEKSCYSLCSSPAEHGSPNCASIRKTPSEVVLPGTAPTRPQPSCSYEPAASQVPPLSYMQFPPFPLRQPLLMSRNCFLQVHSIELEKSNKNGPNYCHNFSWAANTFDYQARDRQLHTWTPLPCTAPAHSTLFLLSELEWLDRLRTCTGSDWDGVNFHHSSPYGAVI